MPGNKLGSILANMATEKEKDGSISGVVKRLRKVQLLDQFAKRLKELAGQAQDAVQIDSAMSSSSVMVAVRLRPFLKHDKTYSTRESCLEIVNGNEINIEDTRESAGVKQKLHKFKFDVFLPEQVTQKRVYVATAKRILVKVLRGYNGTIFAYGQTGSGKTHTMLGDESDRGIIPRVGNDLMQEVERNLGKISFNIYASFVEIYREKICDLLADVDDSKMQNSKTSRLTSTLKAVSKFKAKRAAGGGDSSSGNVSHNVSVSGGRKASVKTKTKSKGGDGWDAHNKPKKKGQDLKVRENKDGVEIVGVSMHKVKRAKDITYLLDLGNDSRHVASHNLNARSSRSHVVFTLYIEQNKLNGEGSATRTKSKFNLIDLAGSERADRTGAKGDLLKEGASINRSLSALGNVIKALTEGNNKKGRKGKKHNQTAHIPYRDSMLTRLLSDSLGGTASTLMCCNLAPGSDHYFETLSSLEFAKRVKKVKNTVKLRTEALSQKEAKKMMNEAETARAEIEQMKRVHEQQMQASTQKAQSAAHAELELMRKELKRHRKESMALVQITKATASNDRSILSSEGQRTAKSITSSDMARLFFVDKRNNRLSYLDNDGSEPTFDLGTGLIGRCAQTGKPIIVHDAPSDERFDPSIDECALTPSGNVKELLIVPVKSADGHTIGVVVTGRGPDSEADPYDKDDISLLSTICVHVSHAIEAHTSVGPGQMNRSTAGSTMSAVSMGSMGQQYHNTMMQIATLCETRSKMAAISETLIDDMISNANATLFFVGANPDHPDPSHPEVWSMHVDKKHHDHVETMKGIVGDTIRSKKFINTAVSHDHGAFHPEIDGHPEQGPSSSNRSDAVMCLPIEGNDLNDGTDNQVVVAALRVIRVDASGAFNRENIAVLELVAPYISAGLLRIYRADAERRKASQTASKLEELQKEMELAQLERNAQEIEAQQLQEEVRKRDIEMKRLTREMKKSGLAAGTRKMLASALQDKKQRQDQAMQEAMASEIEKMRLQHQAMEEQFEKAKRELARATQQQQKQKAQTTMARSMALVGGAQDKRQLRLEQTRADRMERESNKTRKELTQAQKKAQKMQKAHEEEVRQFRKEQARQEAELKKKKQALEKSMAEAKDRHMKNLLDLKSKLRTYRTQVNQFEGSTKSERKKRINLLIRNNISHLKETQLQETLKAMENELRLQQQRYEDQLAEARREAELARFGATGTNGKTASEQAFQRETSTRDNIKADGDRRAVPVTPRRPVGTPKVSSTVRRRNSTVSRHNRTVNRHTSPRSRRKKSKRKPDEPLTMPTMCPEFIEVHNPTRRHQIQALHDNHKICVAVDGSGNSYTALKATFNVLCLLGERREIPIEVCHVPDLDISDSAHDLQPMQVKAESLKEIQKWRSIALDDNSASLSSDGPEDENAKFTYVQAVRFKEGQSVRGTLAYHVNEKSRPKFLVMGMVGSGWAGDMSGQSGPEYSTTVQHNLWCSRTTSIVVHPSLEVEENMVAQTARKWIVAVDGSGRSRSAFDDVCELCDARSDTIIVMHLLMESWEDQGQAKAAASAIESEYCELLEDLPQMDGRVQFECVRVEKSATREQMGLDGGPALLVGEFISEYAKKEQATFLAIGVDGAGVWHDSALKWKAKQRPTPGRTVRYLTSLEHAPCSVLVSLR